MTISYLVGLPGAGKSYEAVRYYLAPALAIGRTVVTNIFGLDIQALRSYCADVLKSDRFGAVVSVEPAVIRSAEFWPVLAGVDHSIVSRGGIPAGAMLILDEAATLFPTGTKPPKEVLDFFAQHRHFVSDDNISCDIVVVTQDIRNVFRSLVNLADFTIRCRKASRLGLTKTYQTFIYEGSKLSQSYLMGQSIRKYDKRVFPLYKSTASSGSVEVVTDKRAIIWRRPIVIFSVFVAPFLLIFLIYRAVHGFFHMSTAKASSRPLGSVPTAAVPGSSVAVVARPSLSSSGFKLVGYGSDPQGRYADAVGPGGSIYRVPGWSCSWLGGVPQSCVVRGLKVSW